MEGLMENSTVQASRRSENINELAAALAKAQGQMSPAKKDTKGVHNSKYADLASCWEAIRKPFADNGLAIMQAPIPTEGTFVSIETILVHSSGQWQSSILTMVPVKNDPQGIGSCLTYARRYALSAMTGVCPEDDDGETATYSKDKLKSQEELGNYMPSFGKFKNKRLRELDPHEISGYVDYIYKKAEKDGARIDGQVRDFVETADSYLDFFKVDRPSELPSEFLAGLKPNGVNK
jgi:hypothetical protein